MAATLASTFHHCFDFHMSNICRIDWYVVYVMIEQTFSASAFFLLFASICFFGFFCCSWCWFFRLVIITRIFVVTGVAVTICLSFLGHFFWWLFLLYLLFFAWWLFAVNILHWIDIIHDHSVDFLSTICKITAKLCFQC